MGILEKIVKSKDVKGYILSDTEIIPDFISTGCAPLNVLFSGRLDGGVPIGKVSQIAAPSALGKSFIGLKVAKNAQKKGLEVLLLDTEYAFDYSFSDNVGVDRDKLLVIQNNRIETAQAQIISTLDGLTAEERAKLIIIIDSWGGLVTSKSYGDAVDGKDVVDMTAAKKKNAFARLLTGMGTTVFIVNQTYETMDQYNPLIPGGGKGVYFASSSIVMATSKARDKDAQDIVGAIVTAKVLKGRFAKEHSKLKYMIKHDGGLHPVAGIEDDLFEMEFITKPVQGWYSRNFAKLGMEGEDKKWRLKEMIENWREFYGPMLKNKDVLLAFEKKFTFTHNAIFDEGDVFEEDTE